MTDYITPARGKPMPETLEAYKALSEREHKLIMQQQSEIASLRCELNKWKQKKSRKIWHEIDPDDESTWPRTDTALLIHLPIKYFGIAEFCNEGDDSYFVESDGARFDLVEGNKYCYIDDILKLG